MSTSASRPSGSRLPLSKVRTAVLTLLVSLLGIIAVLTVTIAGSHRMALQVGMREENFLCDMIVASASIVIHLALERFLRQASRSARCLGAYLLSPVRRLLRKP
jgi:hypothetical protein